MKVIYRTIACLALLALVISAPAAAQQQGQGQSQQPPPTPPKQPGQAPPKQPAQPGQAPPGQLPTDQPAAPPLNKEEEDGYKAFYDTKATEFTLQITLGEEFLAKFPESRYRESVLARIARAYQNTGQEDKMFSSGEKVLAINPDHVEILAMMAEAMPRRVNLQALDANQKLTTAEKYARRVIELVPTLTKPEAMLDDAFIKAKNELLAQANSGLGLVLFYRGQFASAVTSFEEVTKLSATPEPVDFYLLGMALSRAQRFADAATAFEKCAEKPTGLQATCTKERDDAKKKAAPPPSAPKP